MTARSSTRLEGRDLPNLRYRQGVVLVLLAAVAFSFGGLAFRATTDASAWEFLTFRGLGALFSTVLVLVLGNRNRLGEVRARFRPVHAAIGTLMAAMNVLFIVGIELSTVAFVLFFQAMSPVTAAYFSWLLLRERVSRPVVIATAVTIVGVAIMVSGTIFDDVSVGGLIAIGIPVLFGLYATSIRGADAIDPSVPGIVAGLVLLAVGTAATTASGGFSVTPADAFFGFLAGSVLLGFPVAVFNTAQRVVPAAETSLLLMVEVLLAPVWVWLFVDETPAATTVVGGAVILAAVVWLSLRRTTVDDPLVAVGVGRPDGSSP